MKDQPEQPRDAEDLELRDEDADEVVGGDGKTAAPAPTENLTLNFTKIKYENTSLDR